MNRTIAIECCNCGRTFYDVAENEVFDECPECGSGELIEADLVNDGGDFGDDFDDADTFRSIGWGVDEDYGYAEDVL